MAYGSGGTSTHHDTSESAVSWLSRALEVARQRRALLRLGDDALKDIGVSRADAWREGNRHWWDLPE